MGRKRWLSRSWLVLTLKVCYFPFKGAYPGFPRDLLFFFPKEVVFYSPLFLLSFLLPSPLPFLEHPFLTPSLPPSPRGSPGQVCCLQQKDSNVFMIRLFSNRLGSCEPHQLWLIAKRREEEASGPAGFRQAGSGGNKRKPLTNHSVILILSEKRARDA